MFFFSFRFNTWLASLVEYLRRGGGGEGAYMLLDTAMAGKRGLRSYRPDMTKIVCCWSDIALIMKEQSSSPASLTWFHLVMIIK